MMGAVVFLPVEEEQEVEMHGHLQLNPEEVLGKSLWRGQDLGQRI